MFPAQVIHGTLFFLPCIRTCQLRCSVPLPPLASGGPRITRCAALTDCSTQPIPCSVNTIHLAYTYPPQSCFETQIASCNLLTDAVLRVLLSPSLFTFWQGQASVHRHVVFTKPLPVLPTRSCPAVMSVHAVSGYALVRYTQSASAWMHWLCMQWDNRSPYFFCSCTRGWLLLCY